MKEYLIESLGKETEQWLIDRKDLLEQDQRSLLSSHLQPMSLDVLLNKYAMKDDKKLLETNKGMIMARVAGALAKLYSPNQLVLRETRKDWYLWALNKGSTPAGRILSTIGTGDLKKTTSPINCTVSGTIYDSIRSIYERLGESALTQQAGVGIGYAFHRLRPKDSWVDGVNATSSGPVSFADVYNISSATISSDGGRRGAQMLTMDIRHPNATDIYQNKKNNGSLRGFNISVLLPDQFMEDLKRDSLPYRGDHDKSTELLKIFPISKKEYKNHPNTEIVMSPWYDPEPSQHRTRYIKNSKGEYICKVYGRTTVLEAMDDIVSTAWEISEPGVLFIDTINRCNNLWFCEDIEATNPCGEQPLPPNASCLLGSINLAEFIIDPCTDKARVDWESFGLCCRLFHEMLDIVVDVSNLPIKEQKESIVNTRRHGAGLYGIGTTANLLKLKYGSDEFASVVEQASLILEFEGLMRGLELAKEKHPSPSLVKSYLCTEELMSKYERLNKVNLKDFKVNEEYSGLEYWFQSAFMVKFINKLNEVSSGLGDSLKLKIKQNGMRYSHCTSFAPTGTIALTMGNNSSNGIEPSFAHTYFRNIIVKGRKTKLQTEIVSAELLYYRKLINDPTANPPDYFMTAHDVTIDDHLKIMGIVQPYVDSSISKTINLPTEITLEEMKEVYIKAYKLNLKGCTVYRENPEIYQSVLITKKDLDKTVYVFTTEDGDEISLKGSETLVYDGEETTAGNLYDALKEGTYGTY